MAAGLGFKDFTTGEVLTAADVDGYLMQGVWVFADAAARTAAVTSPQEGNISFLKDTNSTEYYSGSAWVAIGGSVPTSLEFAAGKNAVINGGMDIWQRGTSAASVAPNTYSPADRWYLGMGTTGRTISRQTSSLTGIQYSLRIQRDSGNSSTLASYLSYTLESADSYRFAGKTITLSFYARAGANYSPTSSLLSTTLLSGTGTDQNVQNTWTGSATVASGNATLTTSWQRFSFTGTVASSATELGFYWIASWIGTAGANDWFEVTGVQLEAGSTATSFQTATGTLQGELAACQRYYYRITGGQTVSLVAASAVAKASNDSNAFIMFPVPMRVNPTSIDSSAIRFNNYADTTYPLTSVSFNSATASQFGVVAFGTMSGATAGHVGKWTNDNNTAGYLGFSAEL